MSAVLKFEAHLEQHTCPSCFVLFAVPPRLTQERRVDGQNFYCPNGHSMSFTQTEVDKLRAEIERQKRNTEWANQARDSWRRQAESSERKLAATKGVVTRIKNRISKGVCPCCKRSFQDLHRHMNNKHPDYAASE